MARCLQKYNVSVRVWPAVQYQWGRTHKTNCGPVQGRVEGNHGKPWRCWEIHGRESTDGGDFKESFKKKVASQLDPHEMGLGMESKTEEDIRKLNLMMR